VNTEITEYVKHKGWVLYDGDCRFCVRLACRFRPWLVGRHFELIPLQTPWVRTRLGLPDSDLLAEMRLLLPDGRVFGGADALLEISRHYWWARPLRQVARLPVIKKMLRLGYQWVARRRSCAGVACAAANTAGAPTNAHRDLRVTEVLPLLVFPLFALDFRARLAPWEFMWAMAVALYAGCKWLTFIEVVRRGLNPGVLRSLGYLLAWPGMDAANFFDTSMIPTKPIVREWIVAMGKTIFGAVLLWGITRTEIVDHPILAGWTGMIGVIFVLHFGLFHVLALVCRQAGVKVTPLMDKPVLAHSLSEFWGRRWNTAFNELAFRFTFRPFTRLAGPTVALLMAFGLSGLIHELVISVPARGGYGLPTAYFLTQGLGVLTERSRPGRWLGLGRGVRSWLFTLLVTAGPAFWLFHPPFIKHVILPMFNAIGAT
jgi:alginate O-acetyltransferase complex protein AlgI